MGKKIDDLVGKRFNRLIVLGDSGKRCSNGTIMILCKCDCGKETIVRVGSVISGLTKSCGCLIKETALPILKASSNADAKEGTRLSQLNSKIKSNNTTGVRGIYLDKKTGKWIAYMTFKKKRVLYECFLRKQDAIQARKEAEIKYFEPILDKYKS